MAHTSVDVRTEMGNWPSRIGSAPAHAAPFVLHVPRLPNINLGFSLLGQCLAAGKCAKSTITRLVLAAYRLGLFACPKDRTQTIASKNIQQLAVKTMITSLCWRAILF
jgi:hypothetical protein